MSDRTHGRYVIDGAGQRRSRYTAIDPADRSTPCRCGKPECIVARLLPFREHAAMLHGVLACCQQDGLGFGGGDTWESVLFAIQMAASIEDVFANTGYVEDAMTFALCEPAGDFEDGQSEMASKYVAALSIFNFTWTAYEAAVAMTAPDEFRGLLSANRLGERGRRLFESRPELSARIRGLPNVLALAEGISARGGLFGVRLEKVRAKAPARSLARAAELAREFRNFVFHGEDEVPPHPEWSGDPAEGLARIVRFYAVGRLLLVLVQALAWITVGETDEFELPWDMGGPMLTRTGLERLHLRDGLG